MSYSVVEFVEEAGGGVSVIRREWLTPQKQRCFWPPQKLMTKFNKCIDGSIVADTNTWEIFNIKRTFYITDSLVKAREKAKEAEIESEINSDHAVDSTLVRKRKKTRKIYDSDTSDDNSDDNNNTIVYPKQPAGEILGHLLMPSTSAACEESIVEKDQKRAASRVFSARASTDKEFAKSLKGHQLVSMPAAGEESIIEKKQNQKRAATRVSSSTPASTDEEFATETGSSKSVVSLQSLCDLDLTVTPFTEKTPSSAALDIIAKHLARIESDIRELQISQQEILVRVRSSSFTPLEHSLPDGITLPCDDNEALIKIETWVKTTTENGKLLITYLSLVGGNKTPVIIRRILEKLFTNKLAILCNWTGKNNKIPLKDLELIKIIRDAVRLNQMAANATDAEIHEVISNWFRFTKDRNGGREARRAKQ